MPITFSESKALTGNYIISSKWVNIRPITLTSVGLPENCDPEHPLEKLYNTIFRATDSNLYKYTAEVAEHLTNGSPISGLLYPSVIDNNNNHNVALKASDAASRLRMRHATLGHIKEQTTEDRFVVDQLDFATPGRGGSLLWKGRPKQWVLREVGEELLLESGGNEWGWVARTSDGRIREPE